MSVAELSAEQQEIVATVREFVDRDVIPVASDLDHRDEFPDALVETMKALGLFGTTIPEEYGGLGLGLDTYALILIELSRGWVTLPGIMNGSFIASWMLRSHGTEEQRQAWLPRLATGEVRAAFSMTEPHAGSDVQSIRTAAVRDGDEYVLTGQKMWVTNGWRSGLVMLLAKTDPDAVPAHEGITGFLVEKEPETEPPGLKIPMPRAEEARLQGRRVDRAPLRRLPPAGDERARRRGRRRAGLQVLHERHRGRPRQRGRARRRARPGGARRRAALREGARGVRQADRRLTRPSR